MEPIKVKSDHHICILDFGEKGTYYLDDSIYKKLKKQNAKIKLEYKRKNHYILYIYINGVRKQLNQFIMNTSKGERIHFITNERRLYTKNNFKIKTRKPVYEIVYNSLTCLFELKDNISNQTFELQTLFDDTSLINCNEYIKKHYDRNKFQDVRIVFSNGYNASALYIPNEKFPLTPFNTNLTFANADISLLKYRLSEQYQYL